MADYVHRFTSPTLMFRIPGRPITSGGKAEFGGVRKGGRKTLAPKLNKRKLTDAEHNAQKAKNKAEMANIIRLIAKSAMSAQGWKKTNDAVYIVITIYFNYPYVGNAEEAKEVYAKDIPPTRRPSLLNATVNYTKPLEGLVFEKHSQIAGLLLLKRYSPAEEYVDILVGKPNTFKELINDIRNN